MDVQTSLSRKKLLTNKKKPLTTNRVVIGPGSSSSSIGYIGWSLIYIRSTLLLLPKPADAALQLELIIFIQEVDAIICCSELEIIEMQVLAIGGFEVSLQNKLKELTNLSLENEVLMEMLKEHIATNNRQPLKVGLMEGSHVSSTREELSRKVKALYLDLRQDSKLDSDIQSQCLVGADQVS
ncbi:hypothetical protein LguiB_012628 [Lonicera macranthoides]